MYYLKKKKFFLIHIMKRVSLLFFYIHLSTSLLFSFKVNATSIKILKFTYNNIPIIGLNVMVSGITTQTVKILNGISILEFFIEKRLEKIELKNYRLKVRNSLDNSYLSNKT